MLDARQVLRPVRSLAEAVAVPLEKPIYQTKVQISSGLSFLGDWRKKQTELDKLDAENRKLVASFGRLEACLQENTDMRRLLGAPLPPSWQFLPATVIGWKDGQMMIDKGTRDKVSVGMSAVYEDSFVGKVSYAGEFYSKVETPQSANLRIPVVIKDPQESSFTAYGLVFGASERIRFDRVLQEEKILKGDLVFTSGEADFTANLPIGKITEIQKKESDVFQKGEIEPIVSYKKLATIFLIIRK